MSSDTKGNITPQWCRREKKKNQTKTDSVEAKTALVTDQTQRSDYQTSRLFSSRTQHGGHGSLAHRWLFTFFFKTAKLDHCITGRSHHELPEVCASEMQLFRATTRLYSRWLLLDPKLKAGEQRGASDHQQHSECFSIFTHDRGRRSQTAAAAPWRPGWGRWPDAVALQSQRPHPVWHAECASGKPDRWWPSGRYLPDSVPTPGLRSASPSLEEQTRKRSAEYRGCSFVTRERALVLKIHIHHKHVYSTILRIITHLWTFVVRER